MQVYGARKVDVRVGIIQTDTRAERPVGAVLLGVAPPETPWLSEVFPSSVVRTTRYGTRDAALEHLRFVPAQRFDALPGLEGPHPSLVRDSVQLALDAGASHVDLVMARAGDLPPWSLHTEAVASILVPYLSELQEAQIAFPDIAGPGALRPGVDDSPDRRLERVLGTIKQFKAGLREHYQIAYVDLPDGADQRLDEIHQRVGSADVAFCRWTGGERALRAHGWRCAGAALAGLQGRTSADLTGGVAGLHFQVGAGRRVRRTRHPELLQLPTPRLRDSMGDEIVELALDPSAGDPDSRRRFAMVRSEPTLRHPTGSWSLPALRTVKAIHHRIVFAAEQFVFRPVDQVQAFSLVTALDMVLRPFIEGGALVGPSGEGGPLLAGDTVRDRDAPGLVAEISAQLRPWCQDVRVRVAVDPGQQPAVEVFTP